MALYAEGVSRFEIMAIFSTPGALGGFSRPNRLETKMAAQNKNACTANCEANVKVGSDGYQSRHGVLRGHQGSMLNKENVMAVPWRQVLMKNAGEVSFYSYESGGNKRG